LPFFEIGVHSEKGGEGFYRGGEKEGAVSRVAIRPYLHPGEPPLEDGGAISL